MMVLDGAALDGLLHGDVSDPRGYLARFGCTAPPLDEVDMAGEPIPCEVNHGRWIWRCPCRPDGGGVAWLALPLGWCPRCANGDVGGRWRALRFPDERAEIERVLGLRAAVETRNWRPSETVADLERENSAHGMDGRGAAEGGEGGEP